MSRNGKIEFTTNYRRALNLRHTSSWGFRQREIKVTSVILSFGRRLCVCVCVVGSGELRSMRCRRLFGFFRYVRPLILFAFSCNLCKHQLTTTYTKDCSFAFKYWCYVRKKKYIYMFITAWNIIAVSYIYRCLIFQSHDRHDDDCTYRYFKQYSALQRLQSTLIDAFSGISRSFVLYSLYTYIQPTYATEFAFEHCSSFPARRWIASAAVLASRSRARARARELSAGLCKTAAIQ